MIGSACNWGDWFWMKSINGKALVLLLCVGSGVAHAGVYKWVDEQGQVHYGSRPPSGQAANPVRIEKAPPADPYAQQRREKMQKQLDSWSAEREAKPKKPVKQAESTAPGAEPQSRVPSRGGSSVMTLQHRLAPGIH